MSLILTTDPQDMDSSAMMRRASDQGLALETYDPDQLIRDVLELLEARGLHPQITPGTGRAGMAAGASGQLLRAMGILPTCDHTTIDRVNAPDPESR